jgi:corrinoid protein of di/trimethylamine methyltransferase
MDEIFRNLSKAILEYDIEKAKSWSEKAVKNGIDPVKAIDVLTGTIREIGDKFGREELWLPDLIGAAAALQAAMPILEEQIKKSGKSRQSLGRVVIGTVQGDIHSIGKDMVSTLLTAGGFEVINLGVDISADQFITAIKQHNPGILAMSSLLTTTAPEQLKVINILKQEGLRDQVKIVVGGGGITQTFASEIGADGYGSAATDAVDLARTLLAKE